MTRLRSVLIVIVILSGCTQHEDTYSRNKNAIADALSYNSLVVHGIDKIRQLGVSINFNHIHDFTRLSFRENVVRYIKTVDTSHTHTAAILVYRIYPPKPHFKSYRDFYQAVSANLKATKKRFGNILKYKIKPAHQHGQWCVSRRIKYVPQLTLNGSFIYDSYEMICKHPYRPNFYINFAYSERYTKDRYPGKIKQRVSKALNNISFIK